MERIVDSQFGLTSALQLAGGLVLLLYGMRLVVDGLRRTAGRYLRAVLTLVTRNRSAATVAGAAIAVGLQSSNAATAMLVELADGGFVTLEHCVAVVAGAALGATITVQIVAFNAAQYGLLPLTAGFVLYAVTKREGLRSTGQVLMGLGFVYFGMYVMKLGSAPLSQSPSFVTAMTHVAANPALGMLAGLVLTSVVQSSAASLAVAMAVIAQGAGSGLAGDARSAFVSPFVLGVSLGTCSTALIASVQTGRRGKQIAIAHLIVKGTGVIVVLPVLSLFSKATADITLWLSGPGVDGIHAPTARLMANTHSLLTIVTALVALVLVKTIAAAARRLAPMRDGEVTRGLAAKLEPALLATPELAISRAQLEVRGCANLVRDMFVRGERAFLDQEGASLEYVKRMDDRVDQSAQMVTGYLTHLSSSSLSKAEAQQRDALLYIVRDMQFIADIISKDIGAICEKQMATQADLSIEGLTQLRTYWRQVAEDFEPVLAALAAENGSSCRLVVEHERVAEEKKQALHSAHLARLGKGLVDEQQSAAFYMDAVAAVRQAHYYLADAARNLSR
jgi:phosphate:Na+ symporter